LVREDKIVKVEDIKEVLKSGRGIIFTDHTGLKAEDTYKMRNRLSEVDAYIKIIKNTLALLAANQVYKDISFSEVFKGPTSMVVSGEDIINTAKLIKDFTKTYETFKIKAGLIEGKLLSADNMERLAGLPSREVLIIQLLGIMQNPIVRLVSTLKGTLGNMVIVLDMIRRQKEQAIN